jgi:large subunit ribosomal protein L23
MLKEITLKPRLTEKTYTLSDSSVYVIDIDKSYNKDTIAKAVQAQFDVEIASVRIVNIKGKAKRTINLTGKRSGNGTGKRSDLKKAYITLKDKKKLPFFDAIEEEETKQAATQEKIDKAAAKKTAKDEKTTKATKPTVTKKPDDTKIAAEPEITHRRGFRLFRKSKDNK